MEVDRRTARRNNGRAERVKPDGTIPARFVPGFFAEMDQRLALAKEVVSRLNQLRSDAGVDSYQKEAIAQNAIFLQLKIETECRRWAEGNEVDWGSITQQMNALNGLFKTLGIQKHRIQVGSLRSYVSEKRGEGVA